MTDTTRPCTLAWVGLGANLGDPHASLDSALAALARLPDSRLEACSSRYRSAPWQAGGPDFINQVARLRTRLSPGALLDALLSIEAAQGRERPYPNAPRTLDLDLLLHGDTRSDSARLTLPHPRMHQRAFVLAPMLELDPAVHLPGLGPARDWLTACGEQRCERLDTKASLP